MKTYRLDREEWYPVYTLSFYKISIPGDRNAQFSDEEIAEFRDLSVKFKEWQDRIAARFGFEPSDCELLYEESES
jgi:hypothetical protein